MHDDERQRCPMRCIEPTVLSPPPLPYSHPVLLPFLLILFLYVRIIYKLLWIDLCTESTQSITPHMSLWPPPPSKQKRAAAMAAWTLGLRLSSLLRQPSLSALPLPTITATSLLILHYQYLPSTSSILAHWRHLGRRPLLTRLSLITSPTTSPTPRLLPLAARCCRKWFLPPVMGGAATTAREVEAPGRAAEAECRGVDCRFPVETWWFAARIKVSMTASTAE